MKSGTNSPLAFMSSRLSYATPAYGNGVVVLQDTVVRSYDPEKVRQLRESWKDSQSFSRILKTSGRWIFCADVAALFAAFVVGKLLVWLSIGFPTVITSHTLKQSLVFMAMGVASLLWLDAKGHYRQRLPYWETISHLLALGLIGFSTSSLGRLLNEQPFSEGWFSLSWSIFTVFISLMRSAVRRWLDSQGTWEIPVLLVGNGQSAEAVMHAINQEPEMGFNIVERVAPEALGRLKGPNAWKSLLTLTNASHVFLALESSECDKYSAALKALVRERIPSSIIPAWIGLPTGTLSQHHFLMHDVLLLHDTNRLYLPVPRFLKRGFDIVVSSIALVMLAPLFAIIAFKVRKDGGPAFFSQPRVGKNGKMFACYKFRSMHVDAEAFLEEYLVENPKAAEEWKKFQKLRNDVRISDIGHFLRKTSIDELPQLFNVLKGDMSFVGPRPIIGTQQEFYGDDIVYYKSVRPGITGPWQVSGRNKLTFPERVRLECSYARNWSLWMDIVILLKTFPAVLKKDDVF